MPKTTSPQGIAAPLEAASSQIGLHPASGDVQLPLLSVDQAAYRHNRDSFLALAKAYGADVAPHAKTPMCPEIAIDLIATGAQGATVANLQQAEALLEAGVEDVLIANQIGGLGSAKRLCGLLHKFPQARVSGFADSVEAVEILAGAFVSSAAAPFPVFIEVGAGRTGARTIEQAKDILGALQAAPSLCMAGVATYEGAVPGQTPDLLDANMAALFSLTAETFKLLREHEPDSEFIISSGGSVHFDRVISALGPIVKSDGNARLLLRSGAIFFADHGVYKRGFEALDQRALLTMEGKTFSATRTFTPAMRLWAEVLSVPEPGLAIVGMGMRDVAFDQDMPVPLALHRKGLKVEADLAACARVSKLNDQHAFVTIADRVAPKVGDIIEFGISHPCTCFDRWRHFYGTDSTGRIERLYRTFFH